VDKEKKKIILWEFHQKSLLEFFTRVKAMTDMGIPDSRELRLSILHAMAHQKEIERTYVNGETREDIESEIRAWAKRRLKRRLKNVSSRNESYDTGSSVGRFFRKAWRMVKVYFMGGS